MINILNAVGKKMRKAYIAGEVSEKEVNMWTQRNQKEAEALDTTGWTLGELYQAANKTHNPVLREKLRSLIKEHQRKRNCSLNQNIVSTFKLDYYRRTALGLGLRKVIWEVGKLARKGNAEANIIYHMLNVEFANLTAKIRSDKKEVCYERKDILLMDLSYLLDELNWKHGISYQTGKNASYLIYVYLPNGEQISWHTNNYRIVYYYNELDVKWDGQACSTFEKLLSYVHETFNIGNALEKYVIAA